MLLNNNFHIIQISTTPSNTLQALPMWFEHMEKFKI